ncbi:MAG TPA: ScyD/ScyE family protein, partial [Thermomicrobiales bacterium]|nr:ScyD/ScyE family protein [Thermomicrobiales bacterium]
MENSTLEKLAAKRLNRRRFAAGATVAGAALATGAVATRAQEATPVSTAVAASPVAGITPVTVASGLNSPRFIAIDGDTVYFTEAGTGGSETFFATPGAGTPAPTDPAGMRGPSGKLSAIGADGTVTAVVSDFTSYTFGADGEIIGASGVALDGNGNAFVAVGAPGPNLPVITRSGTEGVVYKVSLADGSKSIIADLAQYEIDANPDPYAIDSDLYGAAFLDGVVYVADAGGNDVLAVKVDTGDISTFAVTGGLDAPFLPPSGNPLRGGTGTIDSVPSAIVVGPDGKIYVGFVEGGPFPAGLAPIYDYSPDGTKSVFATGLTMIGGLAFSSDGTLYASVMSTDYVNQKPGQVVRVGTDGTLTVVIDNLLVPAGIAFDGADNLFLVHKSTGFPGAGEILKYTGIVAATGTPFVEPA